MCGCGQLDQVLFIGDGSFRLKFPQGPVDTGKYVNISYVESWEEGNEEEFPGLMKDGWIIAILVSGWSRPAFQFFLVLPLFHYFGRISSACLDHGHRTLGQLLHHFHHNEKQDVPPTARQPAASQYVHI